MTDDLDRASLDRILPSTPGLADWDDVLSRTGAHAGRHPRRLVALAAAALVAAAGTASALGIVRDFLLGTAASSRIAFQSFRDGQFDLYVINANGSGQRRLTPSPDDSGPAWSPDGRRLAFGNYRDGSSEIYVTNADASGLLRLTRDAADDTGPAWSPDGRKIAFNR